jgi:hypothetical protein
VIGDIITTTIITITITITAIIIGVTIIELSEQWQGCGPAISLLSGTMRGSAAAFDIGASRQPDRVNFSAWLKVFLGRRARTGQRSPIGGCPVGQAPAYQVPACPKLFPVSL